MMLDVIEKWASWIGATAGLVTLVIALWQGVWQGLQRPSGGTTGVADMVLRAPLLTIIGVLWIVTCIILWRPLPITVSIPVRIVCLILGMLFYFPGLGLYLWGVKTLGEMYSVSSGFGVRLNVEHRLVTHGPFSLVRHPLYLGLQFAAIGGLLFYRTWTFLFVAVNFLGLIIRAKREEQALAVEFGEQWDVYIKRVPAWIPRFRYKAW